MHSSSFFGDESRCGKSAAEKLAFTCFRDVSPKDWNLIIDMEAVLNSCAQYALGVTQKDATITFPFTLYFRSLLQRCVGASSFQCLTIGSKPEHDATEFSQVRVIELKSNLAKKFEYVLTGAWGSWRPDFLPASALSTQREWSWTPEQRLGRISLWNSG